MIKSSFPTFEQLRAFLVAQQEGSFSGAAETLETTQATISRQVLALEKSLGQTLFYRTTRAIQLTESGVIFEQHARELLQEWQIAKLSVGSLVESVRGEIKLAAPQLFADLYLAPCLPEFLASNSRLALSVTVIEHQESLVESGVDLAIRAGPLTDSALYYKPICHSSLVLVAAPRCLDALPAINSPEDLPKDKCLLFRDDDVWRFDKGEQSTTIVPASGFNTESTSLMLSAVRSGLGFTLVPYWVVAKDIESRTLVTVLSEYTLHSRLKPLCELNFVYPVKKVTKKTQLLMDYVNLQVKKARVTQV